MSGDLSPEEVLRFQEKSAPYILGKTALFLALWLAFDVAILRSHSWATKIPLLLAVGFVITGLVQFAHEAWHHNLFEMAEDNDDFGHFLNLFLPILHAPARHSHMLHHKYNRTEKDPETFFTGKRSIVLSARYYAVILFGLPIAMIYFDVIYPLRHFSRNEWRRHRLVLARFAAFYGFAAIVFHHYGLGQVAWQGWALPLLFASPWNGLKAVADHYANDWKGSRYRAATSIRSNFVVTFFWNGLNYHLEHHLHPKVPGYRLPALHRRIRPTLIRERAPIFESYLSVWKAAWKEGPGLT